ncbi:hypothetical protein FA95DRAFT_1578895, partial [Auriscalpium vulgare]
MSLTVDQLQCRVYKAAMSVARMSKQAQGDGLRCLLRELYSARLATRVAGSYVSPYLEKLFRAVAAAYRDRDDSRISLSLAVFVDEPPVGCDTVDLGDNIWWEKAAVTVYRVTTLPDGTEQRARAYFLSASFKDINATLSDVQDSIRKLREEVKIVKEEVLKHDRRSIILINTLEGLNDNIVYLSDIQK